MKGSTLFSPNAMIRVVTQFHVILTKMEMMTQMCRRKFKVTVPKLHNHDHPQ